MPPKFGTSGLRGLAVELTDALIRDYTHAFLAVSGASGAVHVGQDLRASSPRIAGAVTQAATEAGLDVIDHGVLPTPALALASMAAAQVAVMVTGSHIPGDRNGLKFYTTDGEIEKADEVAILDHLGSTPTRASRPGTVHQSGAATEAYAARYVTAFGPTALSGLRIGVYEHSSVARDVLADVLTQLGAEVVRLARSETFIPVDTEAVDADTREMLSGWCRAHALDALVSTDGDADRPMLTDATGRIVPGDVLGPLTARHLGADVICTAVSSNTLVDAMGSFADIRRTRIGSPYVIAEMQSVSASVSGAQVAGYEANGGFLLGFEADGPKATIPPLMTRDCLLPIVTPLVAMQDAGTDLAGLVGALPARFTASDRLTEIPTERSGPWLQEMIETPERRQALLAPTSEEAAIDLTDGLRVTYTDGSIIHLRPSGNAPEFRCYAEADSADGAEALLQATLHMLRDAF